MSHSINRRDLLKGIGAGAIALSAVGPAVVAGGGRTRYLAAVRGRDVGKRIERAGFTVERELADGEVLLLTGPADEGDELADVEGVVHAERDVQIELERPEYARETDETTDEQFFDLQWDKQVTDVPEAHETATGAGRTVAVVDTGVDHDHPDLPNVDAGAGRLFREGAVKQGMGPVKMPAVGVENLGASAVYDGDCNFLGYSGGVVEETRQFADDVLDHGTHVAGIAAASRNDFGVVGTAPDATVVPLRVFYWIEEEVDADGDGEADTTVANLVATFGGILSAIDHAGRAGVDAMNLSIGTPPLPPQFNATAIRGISERVIENAVRRGSVVVVSAGNADANLQQGGRFTWPNSMAGAMSISATGPNDLRVFYSNFGTNEVSVGAPGGGYETLDKTLCAEFWDPDDDDAEVPVFGDPDEDCESEIVGFEDCEAPEFPFPTNLVLSSVPPEFWGGATHAWFGGTSMAAPQVAGTAALVREVAPDSTARQVEKAIEQGAEDVPGESSADLGAGRLNADRALDASAIR